MLIHHTLFLLLSLKSQASRMSHYEFNTELLSEWQLKAVTLQTSPLKNFDSIKLHQIQTFIYYYASTFP